VAEREPAGRQPGWREVLMVAAGVVGLVLGLAVVTSLLPTQVQEIVFHTPLLIVILIAGTGYWLWRVSRRQSEGREP
jgi:heme A synthase